MGGTELVYNLLAECGPGDYNAGLCIPETGGQARELIQSLAVALVVKGVLTIVTFGIKVPAGIFIPTLGGVSFYFNFYISILFLFLLTVGACFGRMLGIIVHRLYANNPQVSSLQGL